MPTLEYPVAALKTSAAAAMTAAGITVPHEMGKRWEAAHGVPPRYVWVPLRSRERGLTPSRAVTDYRSTFAFREHFAVGCWGRSYAECWALANNLAKALNDDAAHDIRLEGGQWERPGEAWNQKGELYVFEFSLAVPFIDVYVEPAEEPTYSDVSTVVPTVYEADVEQTEDPDVDGETAVVVTSNP